MAATDASSALDFVRNTTESIRTQFGLIDPAASDAQQRRELLVDDKLAPLFDFATASRLVLGKYWPQSSPEQRDLVERALRRRLVAAYSAALAGAKEFSVGYVGARLRKKPQGALVRTRIERPGRPRIEVHYRLRNRGDSWRVVDVVVAGVSLVVTQRKEFYDRIASVGLPELTRQLSAEAR
ncbi:MAG: ABC transporter substrate-binding protein [Gammaproteobacteria bacterium]|nr:ABC transporter substrate-binding protein [Gammaproteobacteria bacterium]